MEEYIRRNEPWHLGRTRSHARVYLGQARP